MSIEDSVRVNETHELRALLSADHQRLDTLFEDLIAASEAGVSTDVIANLWSRFEEGVLAHFDAEERELFSALEGAHPSEVDQLRREHARMRDRLLELDVEVDLHLIRHPTVLEIVENLRAHAMREDGTVYEWADRELHGDGHRSILGKLRGILVSGLGPGTR